MMGAAMKTAICPGRIFVRTPRKVVHIWVDKSAPRPSAPKSFLSKDNEDVNKLF